MRGKIYAIVTCGVEGLNIIEVSDPYNPVLVGSKKTVGDARGVTTHEIGRKIYALVVSDDEGLKIIEVSDP